MKSLKSTRSGGKTLDNRTVAAHLFSQVPDTPSTTDVLGNTDSSGLRKPSIDEDTEFFMSRSISADVSKTPTRSILKMDSNSFRTPSEKTSAPIRSISTSRSVSFRNTRTASESAAPSPLNPASSRAKTLPASQLTESLADYKLTHPSTQTPSRKQSMAGGPSPALLLEENSQLQKQLAKMKLFAQETDSLNKENQIEIQFLVEGKQRMLLEIKTLKEKYENAKTKIVDLEQKLIESERRGRGKGRVELIQDEVHEEILLTKIQLERENCQLKEEYEQVERENIKLKKRIEDMEKGNSSLKSDPELLATQKEIQTLRDLLRGRDLQILQLCLPQNAPPTLHQLYSHPSSSPTTPTISPRKDENEESMSPDTGRDSLHLTQELSQLISESNLLSQAALIPPSPSALLSSTPPSNASQGESLIQDMNEVVCDLVSSKLKIASLLTQLDVEGLKHQLLKTRLAKYATRVSQLEVENISLYSQINTLSSPGVPMQERRGSWYPAWLKKFL